MSDAPVGASEPKMVLIRSQISPKRVSAMVLRLRGRAISTSMISEMRPGRGRHHHYAVAEQHSLWNAMRDEQHGLLLF